MRIHTPVAIVLAFAAGLAASPLVRHVVTEARADAALPAPLTAMMVDLTSRNYGNLPATPNPEMHSMTLVVTENATIALQSGNVAKHIHAHSDEIQYIIEGSGSMWLGNERHDFKPGTLIIVPKGTAHAGTIVANGPVKALAIKIPPQVQGDQTFVE